MVCDDEALTDVRILGWNVAHEAEQPGKVERLGERVAHETNYKP